jgi:predicted transcriptional regulator
MLMANDRITIRVEPELKQWFEQQAKRKDRSLGYVVVQSMEQTKRSSQARDQMIRDAMAEADKGVFISQEAVHKWMDSWDSDNELPLPEPDVFLKRA